MAVTLPNGSLIHIGSAYGSSLTVSAITNANPAVATSTAHGLSNGDYVVFSSGWSRLNNRTFRVAAVTANTFELEGIDTTSVTTYPSGSGIGSVRKVTTWTQIQQVLSSTTSGGEQQFTNYSFLEQNFETQVPTYFSAQSMTIDIADDPSLAGYIALKAAAEARASRALKIAMADGSVIYYYGYVSFNETPSVQKGAIMQVRATFSLQGRPVRYAS